MAIRRMGACSVVLMAALAHAGCSSSVADGTGGGGGDGAGSTSSAAGPSTSSASSATSSVGQGGDGAGGTGGGSDGAGGGVGEGGRGPVPPFRTPVDGPDEEIALRALQILGADVEGAEGGCTPCHALTEANLHVWQRMTTDVLPACLTALDVPSQESAEAMLECVRARSGVPDSKFMTHAIGFWAAGAQRDWWAYTFDTAYPDDGAERLAAFIDQVQMPPDGEGVLPEDDYDLVAEWFVRGAPLLDELLNEPPVPGECDVFLSPAVADHVEAMATTGWRAVNASGGMLMHGCAGADDPRECLAAYPVADAGWHVDGQGVLKVLATTTYQSSFWTRGSAAGRYVGHGSAGWGAGSALIDLQAGVTMSVDAAYDPAFFPDDSGFMFQGGVSNVCPLSVLAGTPAEIAMNEPGCSDLDQVGLYQHVGAALGGGDYFAVSGPFVSDNGGHQPTLRNPSAYFGAGSGAHLTPMVFDGSSFDAKPTIVVGTPFAGDAVMSPSARLLLSRVAGPEGRQNGFEMRRVDATPDGLGGYDVDAPVVARYCIDGGKPAFSYDERWLAIHRYVEDTDEDAQALGFANRSDPGFAPYLTQGAANVWLLELATNTLVRVTDMAPGEYALFPSFRNDGWIYFIVRRPGTGSEVVVASDAALVAEE